jgi:hypothetical protein
VTEGGADESEDAKLTQVDYSSALGNESSDPAYTRFTERIRRGGSDQIIRYCRWNNDARLMISSANKLNNDNKNDIKVEDIPHCPHCVCSNLINSMLIIFYFIFSNNIIS